ERATRLGAAHDEVAHGDDPIAVRELDRVEQLVELAAAAVQIADDDRPYHDELRRGRRHLRALGDDDDPAFAHEPALLVLFQVEADLRALRDLDVLVDDRAPHAGVAA